MNNSLKMIVVLVTVSLVSGAALVFVYNYAQPQIVANQEKQLKEAIFKVLPGAKTYETITKDGEEIYIGKNARGNVVGYAFLAKGSGYQGEILIIAGLKPGLDKIIGIEILKSVETPGLGGMIRSDDFKDEFKGLLTTPKISLVKGAPEQPNEVQAITGATVSSKAVVNILDGKIKKIRVLLKQ